jgi:hypothetical protein
VARHHLGHHAGGSAVTNDVDNHLGILEHSIPVRAAVDAHGRFVRADVARAAQAASPLCRDPPHEPTIIPSPIFTMITLWKIHARHAVHGFDRVRSDIIRYAITTLPRRPHHPSQHALLRVQPVLRLIEHHRLGPIDHLRRHFLPAMRGQAVHEDGIRRSQSH